MDVRVEASILTAGAVAIVATVETVKVHSVEIIAPVVTRFSLTPVISVSGNSISSITPVKDLVGGRAVA